MVNERMYGLGAEPSAIRELFAYGMARKAEIGADNVFDFSIGNPSVPAPDAVKQAVLELMEEEPSALHGYSPAAATRACGPRWPTISAAASTCRPRPTRCT